ncbi:hypothetical protein GP486_002359 [Trichoglossum hirsutum]|uniref:Uncharacterized protein n=1 Tax=Trichoglossum hirsutum TaxID=265104 RepID=A0A9P8RS59_9PEZI|nr:hypothetical protein GP486_002359 [Trichoglossum hirsutum]
MLPRRLAAARPLLRAALPSSSRVNFAQVRSVSQADIDDPDMNGGYVQPPPEKRQFRDPHGDWWDKQERRNYNEAVHEDNDILGMFSLEEYTHTPPGKGFVQLGLFIAAVFGLCGVVYQFYPDKPSAPREFPDGLETELGGPGALRVCNWILRPVGFVKDAG